MLNESKNFLSQANAFENDDINRQEDKMKSPNEKIVDILSNNYLDEEGNLGGWLELEYVNNPEYEKLNEQLEKARMDDLEEFFGNLENLEIIIDRYSQSKTIIEKIKLIKIIGDTAELFIKDEENSEFVKKAQMFLRTISQDENESYFIRTMAHNLYSINIEQQYWWDDDCEEKEDIDRFCDIQSQHDCRFDDINFEFTPEMINKLNYESRDYGSPSMIHNSYEAEPQKDYFTKVIAPSVIGIYSKKGNLIGWKSFENEFFEDFKTTKNEEEEVFSQWDSDGKERWEELISVCLKENRLNKLILDTPLKIKDSVDFKNQTEDLALFKVLESIPFCNRIKKDLGVDLADYSLRNQYQFLQYIKKHKKTDIDKVARFVSSGEARKKETNKMKAFLSLEIDKNNGDRIIFLEEKLSEEDASLVFTKISQLIDLAEQESNALSKIIFKDEQKETPKNVQEELLKKAHLIIFKFSNKFEGDGSVDQKVIENFLNDLEQSRLDIDLVSSLLIAAKKAGEPHRLEDIRGVAIDRVGRKELDENPELAEKLKEMYKDNNSHKSREDLDRLLDDFEKHKDYDPKFYLVYFDKNNKDQPKKDLNNLAGFMRSSSFDGVKSLGDKERYLGAMNIDPLLQRFYFGENFLRETADKEIAAGAQKLIAHVAQDSASHKAALALGFNDTAVEGDYRDDEDKVLAMRVRVEKTVAAANKH